MTVLSGPKGTSPTDNPTSLTYGKYDDLRMPWVGRKSALRVVTVTAAATILAHSNEDRVWICLQNIGAANPMCVGFDSGVVFDQDGIKVNPNNSSLTLDRNTPWPDVIYAICGAGLTTTVLVCEISQIVQGGRGE